MPQEFLTYFFILSVILIALVIVPIGILIFIVIRISSIVKKLETILGSSYAISRFLKKDFKGGFNFLKKLGRK
ncbi:hypothetical protein KKG52_03395 [Patescibacteria group bacterium]|nr:hypothetical protein [Patescibacteria group bacterium]